MSIIIIGNKGFEKYHSTVLEILNELHMSTRTVSIVSSFSNDENEQSRSLVEDIAVEILLIKTIWLNAIEYASGLVPNQIETAHALLLFWNFQQDDNWFKILACLKAGKKVIIVDVSKKHGGGLKQTNLLLHYFLHL